MGKRRRHLILLGAVAASLGVALLLGVAERGSADITKTEVEGCASKPICVTITDQTQASISPSGSPHYTTDSVVVAYDDDSGATSKLVNLTVTMTWKDTDEDGNTITTGVSVFEPTFSDQEGEDCELTAPQTLTCTTPKSLTRGGSITYDPLVFRTATNEDASAFTLSVTASSKEQTNPKQKGGTDPNVAVVTVSNSVTYEGEPDQDVSIGGLGITTTLATAQVGGGTQFSSLPVPAGAPRGFYKLVEQNYGDDVSCPAPAGFTCFGQNVTTTAVGIEPVNLQITYEGPLPAGANEGRIAVVHDRNDGTRVTITAACSSATPSPSEIESSNGCRLVEITRLSGGIARVEISAWDISNGGWGGVG